MRIICVMLLMGIMSAFAENAHSQATHFNLNLQNVSTKTVLEQIEEQSQFYFIYDATVVDVNRKANVRVDNKTIDYVLEQLFEQTDVIYKINDRTIALSSTSAPLVTSQASKVTGKVSDGAGSPLPGVTIVVKGTNRGAITDQNGQYTMTEVPANAVLVFSFVGLRTQEVAVGGKTTLNVTMIEESLGIEEVVAVGYGTVRKSDLSGSVASVNTNEMMKKAPTNILQGLQGAAAGVMVMAQDGAPEANAAIRIRGVATIHGTANPLYVVDGVQVGTSANFLAPSDIANIEILKDASATAIYGAAGANGVILITTKHGQVGTTRITVSADFGVQTLARKLEVGDVEQFAKNIRTGRANDGANLMNQVFAAKYDGQRNNVDWQDVMTRTSLKQQYNLSASGGTEKTQSNFSLNYLNNDGIVVNSNYNRLTARANIVTKAADFIEIGGDINFVHSQNHGSNAGTGNNGNLSSLRDMAFMCPTLDYVNAAGTYVSPNVINDNGTYGASYQTSVDYDGGSPNNLYAEQMENNGLTKTNQLFTSAYADLKLFKGLNFKTIASYNLYVGNFENFWGNKKRYESDGVTQIELANYDTRYHLQIDNNQSNTLAIESYLTYNWKNDLHSVSVMAGNSVSKSFGSWTSANAVGFPGDNIRDISLTSDLDSKTGSGAYNLQVRGISYFGRAMYSFRNRYILTGTVRHDGSSNFGVGNRWGTFPSGAFAWRISEENFMKSIAAITNLKLRLGWGQTGNSGGATDKNVAALTSSTIAYYFYGQNGVAGLGSTRQTANGLVKMLVDTNLKWETNEQSNIGIDLGLLNNDLNITVDYFTRKSTDLLLDRAIRPSAGYTSVYTNFGEIQNKGVEFSIAYKKQLNRDWNISATLTGSTLKNKIVEIGPDQFYVNGETTNDGSNVGAVAATAGVHWDGHSIMREGYAVGSFYGYKVEGVFQSKEEVDAANAAAVAAGHTQYQMANTSAGDFKYKDLNDDGFIDSKDMTILGNGFPKLNYGLTLNAEYKNWDFSVYTYGVAGQDIYSYSSMTLSNIYGTDNGTIPNILKSSSNEAWTSQNHSTTLSKLSILDYNQNMRGSDAWVKKGDFFKISNVQIGYNFSKETIRPLRMQSARIYASIQNLACFSSYNKYGDPEAGQGSVLYTGLDTGRYPMPRIYSFGLNVQF